ncbi:MAG: DNA-formamidopyrimidine glycosylase family protein [Candidatus Riflemargulisbacteria bacterium]
MPELPEVETISQDLNAHLSGKTINTVTILDNRNLREIDSNSFIKKITAQTINSIYRKGKALIVDVSNGYSIIFHLRMTGKFIIQNKTLEYEKHSMVIFATDTEHIIFADIRKFATINVIETLKLHENKKFVILCIRKRDHDNKRNMSDELANYLLNSLIYLIKK